MANPTWKGTLSLGLVNIPVSLFTAARAETISFNQLHSCGSRINQETVCKACNVKVERSELLKGYEYLKGQYITIAPEELESMEPESSKVLEITETVAASQIDPLLFEASYYLAPDKGGDSGYALIYTALLQSGKYAIGRLTRSNREHVVVIRPVKGCLILHTLYYQDEVREVPVAHVEESNSGYLKLAKQLLESIEVDFDHGQYSDGYRQNIQVLIDAKVAGHSSPKKAAKTAKANAPNIHDALIASIEAKAGKVAKSELSSKKKKAS